MAGRHQPAATAAEPARASASSAAAAAAWGPLAPSAAARWRSRLSPLLRSALRLLVALVLGWLIGFHAGRNQSRDLNQHLALDVAGPPKVELNGDQLELGGGQAQQRGSGPNAGTGGQARQQVLSLVDDGALARGSEAAALEEAGLPGTRPIRHGGNDGDRESETRALGQVEVNAAAGNGGTDGGSDGAGNGGGVGEGTLVGRPGAADGNGNDNGDGNGDGRSDSNGDGDGESTGDGDGGGDGSGDGPGRGIGESWSDSTDWQCGRKTRRGHCTHDVLNWFDAAYRPYWPGGVDLLVRSYLSDRLYLLHVLFNSVEMMWPRGIGDVILVLDKGTDEMALDLIPDWVQVKFEENYLKLPGKFLQQWSYLWADNYTTAPFIAIIDDDVVLQLKVTPPLLFNLSSPGGPRPYVLGSMRQRSIFWKTAVFFNGPKDFWQNYMANLPFVMPRNVLPDFRRRVAEKHKDKGGSFDAAMKWWSQHGSRYKDQIAHSTIGTYLWRHARDKIHFAHESDPNQLPIPRCGVHVVYTLLFDKYSGKRKGPRATLAFLRTATAFSRDAMCSSFPPGELPNCPGSKKISLPPEGRQASSSSLGNRNSSLGVRDGAEWEPHHIWRYAVQWEDWEQLRRNATRGKAKRLFWQHRQQLRCLYWEIDRVLSSRRRGGGRISVEDDVDDDGIVARKSRDVGTISKFRIVTRKARGSGYEDESKEDVLRHMRAKCLADLKSV